MCACGWRETCRPCNHKNAHRAKYRGQGGDDYDRASWCPRVIPGADPGCVRWPRDRSTQRDGCVVAVPPWPLIAIHTVLMPDGRVLTYGTDGDGRQTGYYIYDVWDPAAGLNAGHFTLPNDRNRYLLQFATGAAPGRRTCSLRVATTGPAAATTNTGNNNTNLFDYDDNTLATRQQHEPAALVLDVDHAAERRGLHPGRHRRHATAPRSARTDGTFRLAVPARTRRASTTGTRATSSRRTAACSASTVTARCTTSAPAARVRHRVGPVQRADRAPTRAPRCSGPAASCSSAATPTAPSSSTSPAARPGNGDRDRCRRSAAGSPRPCSPTARCWPPAAAPVDNQLTDVNNTAEIWDPGTGTLDGGCRGERARLYHSTSLLLPDATVLVGGRRRPGSADQHQRRDLLPALPLQRRRPVRAGRPSLAPVVHTSARLRTSTVSGRHRRSAGSPDQDRSVTHSFNMEQRFIELTFTGQRQPLMVRHRPAPPMRRRAATCCSCSTPGVPSVARIVKVNVATVPNPAW